jgi:hypothetical protein
MRIEDISPGDANATRQLPRTVHGTSGKALCVAISFDGRRAYLGGHSGVWRSDDGGANWYHPEWPQPAPGSTQVPGALLAPNVYDLHIDPRNPNIVLAATGRDARVPTQAGIYRSNNGALNWTRVHTVPPGMGVRYEDGSVGCFSAPRDSLRLVYAAGGSVIARSSDGGASWTNHPLPLPNGARVFHVAAGIREGKWRRVYALGSQMWFSRNGGDGDWAIDPEPLIRGFPTDGLGPSAQALAVHPDNPAVVYVMLGDGRILRGEYPPIASPAPGTWSQIPSIPIIPNSPTDSGGDMIVPLVTASGDFLLFASDRRTVHVAFGEPTATSDWKRIEDSNCHCDPHGMAFTPDFHRRRPRGPVPPTYGRALLVNDGGVVYSDDGAKTWKNGRGLSTLGVVNAAVNPRPKHAPAICMGHGDNSGFSTPDGGKHWETQDYGGGDNDACFADPLQPSRLIVFAPRHKIEQKDTRYLYYYRGSGGGPPDASWGTDDRTVVPSPHGFINVADAKRHHGWNAVSNFYNWGYRPLILTAPGESAPAELDFITIRRTPLWNVLLRTTRLTSITNSTHWGTNATADGPGVRVFRQGPALPSRRVDVVQGVGGHADPTFYVGDPSRYTDFLTNPSLSKPGLWTWRRGEPNWRQIVGAPNASRSAPKTALRFFAHSYRPEVIYVLSDVHVFRSDDRGASWIVDASLERMLTEDGAFPFVIPEDGNPDEALLRDMAFDPQRPGTRFAAGPAGVFVTEDGRTWRSLLRTSTIATRVSNITYDFVTCPRALYVSTMARGLLRLSPLGADWDYPPKGLFAAEGRITLLRVHDLGTGYGPPADHLDAEVIVNLDSEPEKAFGLQLRTGAERPKAEGMLALLRDAFARDRRVRIDFMRNGCRTGRILRVIELP